MYVIRKICKAKRYVHIFILIKGEHVTQLCALADLQCASFTLYLPLALNSRANRFWWLNTPFLYRPTTKCRLLILIYLLIYYFSLACWISSNVIQTSERELNFWNLQLFNGSSSFFHPSNLKSHPSVICCKLTTRFKRILFPPFIWLLITVHFSM